MKEFLMGMLRLVVMVVWTAFGFCWGFFAGTKVCEWWMVPIWVREYPHDGQLGLGVLAFALGGGLLCAIFALVFGMFLILRVPRAQRSPD